MNNSDIARRSTAPTIFNENNNELVYAAPNAVIIKIKYDFYLLVFLFQAESIRPQLDPCDLHRTSQQDMYHRQEPEIRIDYLDSYDDEGDDDDGDDEDEATSAQLREQYTRTHGLRRHTIGRPDLLIHGGPIPTLASKVRFAHQSSSIEPTLLTNRLTNLQQRQEYEPVIITNDNDDEFYSQSPPLNFHQKTTHSTSYNGLSTHAPMMNTASEVHDHQQRDNQWLSPPVSNNFRM